MGMVRDATPLVVLTQAVMQVLKRRFQFIGL